MLAIVGAERVASGANFRNGGLVTTDMAAALQLQRTVEYQEKALPSLIRLGSISPDEVEWLSVLHFSEGFAVLVCSQTLLHFSSLAAGKATSHSTVDRIKSSHICKGLLHEQSSPSPPISTLGRRPPGKMFFLFVAVCARRISLQP